MNGEIFINYRSADTHSYAGLLYLELSRCFGPDLVFLDSESIPAGADFVEQLLGRVRRARAMLAVIGPAWLSPAGSRWWQRRREPIDWTRRELVEAFAAGVPVIPVLTEDTCMPTRHELPPGLMQLSRCQYRRLRCSDLSADLDRIVNDLIASDPQLQAAARQRPPAAVQPARALAAPDTPRDRDGADHDRPDPRVLGPARQPPAAEPAPAATNGGEPEPAPGQRPDHRPSRQASGPSVDLDPHAAIYRALIDSRKRFRSPTAPG
jgi:hypothetical protein